MSGKLSGDGWWAGEEEQTIENINGILGGKAGNLTHTDSHFIIITF